MKTRMIVLISVVTFTTLTLPILAEPVSDTDPQRDLDVTQMRQTSGFGDLRRANEIIGADIRDAHGAKLGTVRDLGLDLQNGRIAELIIATHAETSLPDKFTALPPESFVCEGPPMTLRLKADRAQIASAPTIEFSHWNDSTGNAQLLAVYTRFGADPYFVNDALSPSADIERGQVTKSYSFPNKPPLVNLGYIARASKLMGSTAWNIQGEKLARVDNFVVDVPQGRVVEVILGRGGFLGMRRQLTAVPPQAFRLSKDNTVVGLDTTQEALDSAPHFRESDWKMANQPDRVTAAYALFNINPYFIKSDLNPGAENVRARTENSSATEHANQADMDTTAQIRQAIAANGTLSADAKKATIVTSDGKVTITGTVLNDGEKRQIGEAAAKIVSAEKVDNQLDVRPTPLSTPDQ